MLPRLVYNILRLGKYSGHVYIAVTHAVIYDKLLLCRTYYAFAAKAQVKIPPLCFAATCPPYFSAVSSRIFSP